MKGREKERKREKCEKREPQHLYEPPNESRCSTGVRTVILMRFLRPREQSRYYNNYANYIDNGGGKRGEFRSRSTICSSSSRAASRPNQQNQKERLLSLRREIFSDTREALVRKERRKKRLVF